MGYEFKPSIWFVCRYCRQAFRYLYKLKEHKVESHLGECLKTKCLIFEERSLDHEWIPSPDELRRNDGPSSSSIVDNCNRRHSYRNPYVSLKPLSPQQLSVCRNENQSFSKNVPAKTKSQSCRRDKRTADRLVSLPSPVDPEPCTIKKCKLELEYNETEASVTTQQIVFNSEVPKIELDIEGLNRYVENAVMCASSMNLVSISNDDDQVNEDFKEIELEDREFIVASIIQSSDGTGNIQFVSTHIPPNDPGIALQTKKVGSFHPFSDTTIDLETSNTNFECTAAIEHPNESQLNLQVPSSVLGLAIEHENDGNVIQEEDLFNDDDGDPVNELRSPEECFPIETENISSNEFCPPAELFLEPSTPKRSINDSKFANCLLQKTTRTLATASQIISDSNPNAIISESNSSFNTHTQTLRSRYNRRRNKAQVNYPEPQACRGCARDFNTVEDAEDHQKLCQFLRNKTIQAKQPEDEEIQVIGSVTKKTYANQISSDEDDNYESSSNSESDTVNDDVDCVIDRPPTSKGHSQKNQIPTVILSPEDLSLSLLDWITREKASDPSNVILLDPDPASETLPVAVNDCPTKCVLCKLVLTSDTQIKEHVKVCWTFNKAKHAYCVPCKKSYSHATSLKRHCKSSHVPANLIANSEIVEPVDDSETAAQDVDLNQPVTKTGSQINSASYFALNVSQAYLSESGSIYISQRNLTKLQYPETQACRGCSKDFNTVEDVEDHEKVCQLLKIKTKENEQAKEPVDDEIQVVGSITKKTGTNEIASDDEDRYERPNNSESGTENEDADCILDRRRMSQGHIQINHILPTVTLSPEDLSLSLLDWITKEKASDPSNVILLDPDPASETLPIAVSDLHPMKCVLCKLVLTSDTQVKEHVKVCWTFNKAKHVYCVLCQKTYCSPSNLKRHCKRTHVPPSLITNTVVVEPVTGTEAEAPDTNSNVAITEMGSQINSASISALNVSEANLSESESRLSTRRNKPKLNYSETQACKGCAKDFYTVEDLEDHKQLCPQLNPQNVKNKETQNMDTEDDEIEVIRSTAENTLANTVAGDDDDYECPDSSGSSSDLESAGCVTDPQPSSHYCRRRRGAKPTNALSPEDLSLPLVDWLKKEKINDHSNVILLDPDPTNETAVVEVTFLHPVKCVLCKLELTSDTQVKEHVKVCWRFSKSKHSYCVPCNKSFSQNVGLLDHRRITHKPNNWVSRKDKPKRLYCIPCKPSYTDIKELEWHNHKKHNSRTKVVDVLLQKTTKTLEPVSQIGSDSNPNAIISESNSVLPDQTLGSRYNTRRSKAQVNYSESQACRGCGKDFYTVEDVEDHEKLCQLFRNRTKENEQAKETVDEEIQVIGSITKKNRTVEIASDEDDDKYESPNSESDTENDDADCVIDRRPRSQGHSQINQILPTVTLSPEDLSLSLLDWITKEKSNNPSNIILLDPDPTSETLTVSVNNLHPMKCVLCKLKLTSDTQVKEHVKVCWTFNKAKHAYCVPCKKTYSHATSLKRHCTSYHVPANLVANSEIVEPVDDSEAEPPDVGLNQQVTKTASQINSTEVDEIQVIQSTAENTFANEVAVVSDIQERPNSSESSVDLESDGCVTDPLPRSHDSSKRDEVVPTVTLNEDDLSLPLLDWLKKEKINDPSNVILLDPDPTNETAVIEVTSLKPVKCVLCKLELISDTQVKEHVKVCWHSGKANHSYCVPCKIPYSNPRGLRYHHCVARRPITPFSMTEPSTRHYALPLKEWLALQQHKQNLGGPSNTILIDPDPRVNSQELPEIDEGHPVTCLLCSLLLVSELDVKIHVENCWWHNKEKHRRCVPCEFTFDTPKILRKHKNYDHVGPSTEKGRFPAEEESDDSDAEHLFFNQVIPLNDWLKKRQEKSSNVIRLDPDPTHATGPITISKKSPIQCKLCGTKLASELVLKTHVKVCWRYKKKNHRYCVPCEEAFSGTTSLNDHNFHRHFLGPKFPLNCTYCRIGFTDYAAKRKHTDSRRMFLRHSQKSCAENSAVSPATGNETHFDQPLFTWLKEIKERNPFCIIALKPDPLSLDNFEGVSKSNPVTCKLCLRKFTAESCLRSHVEICWFHNKRRHLYCVPCDKTYETSCKFKLHFARNHSTRQRPIYECKVCSKTFITLSTFKAHEETHVDPEKAKPFKCQLCSSSFVLRAQLTHHMFSHSSDRQFKCPHCPSAFKTKEMLKYHLTIHAQEKHSANKCRFCGRFFIYLAKLKDHERIHTGDRPFKCQVANCSETFSSSTLRCIHTKRAHGEELGLRSLCPTCGKTFALPYELDYHIRIHHTDASEKPFKCPHEGCTKRFAMKFQIAPHMLLHTSEKPFQCEQCGRAFSSKQTFKRHQLTHSDESAENVVRCNLCPKTFRGDGALKRHLKVHEKRQKMDTAGSKFKCQLCGKGYSTKSSLNKHEETHEEDEDESEEAEGTESESEESTNENSESGKSENSDDGKEEIQKDSV